MAEKQKPLPKTQAELLDAMQRGVKCHYMPYFGWFNRQEYYFRSDTNRRCTAAAKALLERNLVVMIDRDMRGHHTLIAKEQQ